MFLNLLWGICGDCWLLSFWSVKLSEVLIHGKPRKGCCQKEQIRTSIDVAE